MSKMIIMSWSNSRPVDWRSVCVCVCVCNELFEGKSKFLLKLIVDSVDVEQC